MARRRTRKDRIDTLEHRLAYLTRKRDELKATGRPHSYLTDEIDALEWALPVLRGYREAALVTGADRAMARPEVVARCLDPDAWTGVGYGPSAAAQSRESSLQMGEEVVAALDAQARELAGGAPGCRRRLPRGQGVSELVEVRQTHPYGFRSGEWARVLTTVESRGRACWLVRFPDGVTDWWVIEDPDAVYEVRGETPNGPREVRGP